MAATFIKQIETGNYASLKGLKIRAFIDRYENEIIQSLNISLAVLDNMTINEIKKSLVSLTQKLKG